MSMTEHLALQKCEAIDETIALRPREGGIHSHIVNFSGGNMGYDKENFLGEPFPTGCATRWHVAEKDRKIISLQESPFSQIAHPIFTQEQVSLSVPFPLSTRLRYFSLCSHRVRTLNWPAKRLENIASLVAHPVGGSVPPISVSKRFAVSGTLASPERRTTGMGVSRL